MSQRQRKQKGEKGEGSYRPTNTGIFKSKRKVHDKLFKIKAGGTPHW